MSTRTRLVLADDHPIFLAGLRNLLEREDDFELVGEATSGSAALKLIRETTPDIAVIDISMPDLNGIALGRLLAAELPDVRLLALTLHEEPVYVKQAAAVGIRGYVLKRSAAENLVPAIRAVMHTGFYFDPAIADVVFDQGPARPGRVAPSAENLSEREVEVLKLNALGFSSKEIAKQIGLSAKTVETYKTRGFEKLALSSRADLISYAINQGWFAAA